MAFFCRCFCSSIIRDVYQGRTQARILTFLYLLCRLSQFFLGDSFLSCSLSPCCRPMHSSSWASCPHMSLGRLWLQPRNVFQVTVGFVVLSQECYSDNWYLTPRCLTLSTRVLVMLVHPLLRSVHQTDVSNLFRRRSQFLLKPHTLCCRFQFESLAIWLYLSRTRRSLRNPL